MTTFKVGDIAVGQNFNIDVHRNGMVCTVVGPLEFREAANNHDGKVTTGLRYRVQWADGVVTVQEPHFLRRQAPPQREIDTVVSWSDCAWKPSQQVRA